MTAVGQDTQDERPPLSTRDTFDAPQLLGTISRDGSTALLRAHDDVIDQTAHNAGHAPLHDAGAQASQDYTITESQSQSQSPERTASDSCDDTIEDYDDLELDPDTLVANSRKSLHDDFRPSEGSLKGMREKGYPASTEAKPISNGRPKGPRRRSIQIRLEKTDRKGHYVIVADDPEIREVLRKGIERQEQINTGKKPRIRFRDLVFTRQFTTFDPRNPASSESPFFGFFTLFWIAMVSIFFQVAMHNWREYGSILGRNQVLKMMFSRDVVVLALTDAIMCGATVQGLLFQKLITWGYFSWAKSGWIIQNIWQSGYLGMVIWWTWYREWPWTHTIFIVLHALVFLMKQHSYSFYNGYLSSVYRRRRMLQNKLQLLKDMEPVSSAPNSPVRMDTATGIEFPSIASHSRQSSAPKTRRPSLGPRTSTNLASERSDVASVAVAIESGSPLDQAQMEAFEDVIQIEIDELTKELQGKSTSGKNAYPNNLTLSNFADWTFLPTLVYELEYPRQERTNWYYVAEKTAATFGVICVMMVISQSFLYPPFAKTLAMKEAGMSVEERWREFPWIVSEMLFPLLIEQLLTWYVIWECILNVLAEVTRFADRGFYGDWWNSVSWDQYARDWNRPVHNFLLRHVYHSSISTFHLSRNAATFMTFLLSALVHEFVMAILFKKVRGYLLMMQLLQMPLVTLSRTKLMKDKNVLGNIVFWVGLFVGPSFLTSLYLII
ncbi:acyl-CoA/sterol acyltransferase [Polychaeton citri CBS 116435]|uniref:Acyl-CoA/sterol acyltransferase n=1 Tax=Polychaeton citri CBS 116435 TaxID=1314669 RepID=A0A9P4QCX8_9PEZI|nr:acyl-CoA/sterol acyltransferase [Polychaeton citri CBS 116435]